MLYTISSKSKINFNMINEKDAILFWQNGTACSLSNNAVLSTILAKTLNCYVLEEDIQARNITKLIDKRVKIINMQQVLQLTEKFSPQIKW